MNLCSSHSKTNKPLGRETIYAMLKNPFYYGEMVIRGEKMPHASEPLISKSLYDKAVSYTHLDVYKRQVQRHR